MIATRRAFLVGAAAAVVAPAVAPAAPAPQVFTATFPVPAPARLWLHKTIEWMLAEDFDDDGYPWHLTRHPDHLIHRYVEESGVEPAHGNVVRLRRLTTFGELRATVHPYDEEADEYPPITLDRELPPYSYGELHFQAEDAGYGSLSVDDALDGADPGTYTVSVYAFSAAIPHRWDAVARQFIPLEPANEGACEGAHRLMQNASEVTG